MQCLIYSEYSRLMTSIPLDRLFFLFYCVCLHVNWSRLVCRDEPPLEKLMELAVKR